MTADFADWPLPLTRRRATEQWCKLRDRTSIGTNLGSLQVRRSRRERVLGVPKFWTAGKALRCSLNSMLSGVTGVLTGQKVTPKSRPLGEEANPLLPAGSVHRVRGKGIEHRTARQIVPPGAPLVSDTRVSGPADWKRSAGSRLSTTRLGQTIGREVEQVLDDWSRLVEKGVRRTSSSRSLRVTAALLVMRRRNCWRCYRTREHRQQRLLSRAMAYNSCEPTRHRGWHGTFHDLHKRIAFATRCMYRSPY